MAKQDQKTLWNRIGDILQARELYLFLTSTSVASSFALWVGSILPSGYDTQAKILVGLASFTGAGLVALVLTNTAWTSAPQVQQWWRRTFGEPPQLRVVPFNGESAVLEIHNDGGTAVVSATGQIVAATAAEQYQPAVHINRQDTYPMIWRSDFEPRTLIIVRGTRLRKGSSAKLLLGGFAIVKALVNTYTVLRIFGGDYEADKFSFAHGVTDSPTITVEVTLTAEPPLRDPCVRRYQIAVRRRTGVATVRELAAEEA